MIGDKKTMTEDEFVRVVMRRLPELQQESEKEFIPFFETEIRKQYQDGFSVGESVEHARSTEHINPALDEDIALKRMARIREQVKKRNQ